MSELGDLLKILRGKRSLREAGKLTGISHNYLSIVERGVDPRSGAPVNPTPETLEKLSEAYNYSYEELMKKAGYIKASDVETKKEVAEKLIEYIELELTNEEIKERMVFKVDNLTLSDGEIDEFISFIRWQRSKKKEQPAALKHDEP